MRVYWTNTKWVFISKQNLSNVDMDVNSDIMTLVIEMHMRERHMNNEGHIREVLILENPKELEKSQIFSWKLSKFSKYIGQGVPLPPWKKFFYCSYGWIRTCKKNKKKLWKCQHFGMTPPPSCENSQLFFFFEWILPLV